MKLTVQLKLLPSAEQSTALRATLETVNAAANRLSELAWPIGEFRRIPLHKAFYRTLRDEFPPLSAQAVVRLIAKVADAYTLDQTRQRTFRKHGSISYDARILSFTLPSSQVSIWTVEGRLKNIPFVCGEAQRKLLELPRSEADLILHRRKWFLNVTVEVPEEQETEAADWLGVDLGIVAIAHTSDGERFAGGHLNGLRARHRRLRRKLQIKGTRAAKRLARRRSGKENRFSTATNHIISKRIVSVAQRTGRGIALENLSGIHVRTRARKAQRAHLHSWAFGQLQRFIVYKARRGGVPVKFVNARNTSRRCSSCGHVHRSNRRTQSKFLCQRCQFSTNADANASENIRRAAATQPNSTGVDAASAKILCANGRSPVESPTLWDWAGCGN